MRYKVLNQLQKPHGRVRLEIDAPAPAGTGVDRLAAGLRLGTPAVVGRVQQDRLLLDLRTVLPRQDTQLVAAVEAVGSAKE